MTLQIPKLFSFAATALAGPIGLPESARPGAVRPDSDLQPTQPPQPAGEVLEIPAVIDRPFDIDEGEIVVVSQFRLLNAQDIPDFEIVVAEVDEFLEKICFVRVVNITDITVIN